MHSGSGFYSFVVTCKPMQAGFSYMHNTIIKNLIFKTHLPFSDSNIRSNSPVLVFQSEGEQMSHQ